MYLVIIFCTLCKFMKCLLLFFLFCVYFVICFFLIHLPVIMYVTWCIEQHIITAKLTRRTYFNVINVNVFNQYCHVISVYQLVDEQFWKYYVVDTAIKKNKLITPTTSNSNCWSQNLLVHNLSFLFQGTIFFLLFLYTNSLVYLSFVLYRTFQFVLLLYFF